MGTLGIAFKGPSGIPTGCVGVVTDAVAAVPELSLEDCLLGVGLLGGTRADVPNVSVAFWSDGDEAIVALSLDVCLLGTGLIGWEGSMFDVSDVITLDECEEIFECSPERRLGTGFLGGSFDAISVFSLADKGDEAFDLSRDVCRLGTGLLGGRGDMMSSRISDECLSVTLSSRP